MTAAEGRRIQLNPAQRRGLKNWPADVLPRRTCPVAVGTPDGPSPNAVQGAVRRLVERHEGLRSQLVPAASGGWEQLVRSPGDPWGDPGPFTLVPLSEAEEEDFDLVAVGDRLVPVDPMTCAIRCLLFVRNERVRGVLLSVSHMFADGVSQQLLSKELADCLAGPDRTPTRPVRQASDFAGDRLADIVRENTAAWKGFLQDVPRACTFSAALRKADEEVAGARVTLTEAQVADVRRAARALRVTPYTVWTTATSVLVSRYTGQHSMAFKTQMANRRNAEEFAAVAYMAQAGFIPLPGTGSDTLRERARAVLESSLKAHEIGVHDTVELLGWMDSHGIRRGASFRPAFEMNYAASIHGADLPQLAYPAEISSFTEPFHFDPFASAAILSVEVWQGREFTSLAVRLTTPLQGVLTPEGVVGDLFTVIAELGSATEKRVVDVPVKRLLGQSDLIDDPLSGTGVDEAMMLRLLRSHPAVASASVQRDTGWGGTGRGGAARGIDAAVVVDRPVTEEELMRTYVNRQRWMDGTVVPATLSIVGNGEEPARA